MTLPVFAERIEHAIANGPDRIEKQETHARIVFTVTVGRQTFVVTCEEGPHDRGDPEV